MEDKLEDQIHDTPSEEVQVRGILRKPGEKVQYKGETVVAQQAGDEDRIRDEAKRARMMKSRRDTGYFQLDPRDMEAIGDDNADGETEMNTNTNALSRSNPGNAVKPKGAILSSSAPNARRPKSEKRPYEKSKVVTTRAVKSVPPPKPTQPCPRPPLTRPPFPSSLHQQAKRNQIQVSPRDSEQLQLQQQQQHHLLLQQHQQQLLQMSPQLSPSSTSPATSPLTSSPSSPLTPPMTPLTYSPTSPPTSPPRPHPYRPMAIPQRPLSPPPIPNRVKGISRAASTPFYRLPEPSQTKEQTFALLSESSQATGFACHVGFGHKCRGRVQDVGEDRETIIARFPSLSSLAVIYMCQLHHQIANGTGCAVNNEDCSVGGALKHPRFRTFTVNLFCLSNDYFTNPILLCEYHYSEWEEAIVRAGLENSELANPRMAFSLSVVASRPSRFEGQDGEGDFDFLKF